MLRSEMKTTQLRLNESEYSRSLRVFSPPGIFVEAAKYPTLWTGFLASTEPSEHLSIHDHPGSWRGLGLETILMMREQLFRFVLPMDARLKEPDSNLEMVQNISLSVSPVALSVEVDKLPPRNLQVMGAQLPFGPMVPVRSMDMISEPEISRVARKITEDDIPASEAIWKLIDYDYTLEQVSRMMAVGLLGKKKSRRLIPTRAAYKAVTDTYLNRAIMELADKKDISVTTIQAIKLLGDTFTILVQPGAPEVDYIRVEQFHGNTKKCFSFEDKSLTDSDAKASIYANQARFSAYHYLVTESIRARITIFHLNSNPRSNALGPWLARAGVKDALESPSVELEDSMNVLNVLQSILKPRLDVWAEDTSLLDRIGPRIQQLVLH